MKADLEEQLYLIVASTFPSSLSIPLLNTRIVLDVDTPLSKTFQAIATFFSICCHG